MADGYDYDEPPKAQSPTDKLKSCGFTTGQAIGIAHVSKSQANDVRRDMTEAIENLRAEMEAEIRRDRDNANTGRYIVTVGLCAAVLVGIALGKVFA